MEVGDDYSLDKDNSKVNWAWRGGRERSKTGCASECAKEKGPERRMSASFQGLFIQTLLSDVYIKADSGVFWRYHHCWK